jgi:protocatechuate 3,4-dioxygenase beta subunit
MGSVLTDQDGYYSYMGLTPGTYTIKPDEQQLNSLGMASSAEHVITIEPSKDGAYIEQQNFSIQAIK